MKKLVEHGQNWRRPLRLSFAAWMISAVALVAEPIRIVSWNLEALENAADKSASLDARINSAALVLGRFKPDVVLLQEVPDWKTSADIASRIDTKFGVRICSAYGGEGPQRSRRQMAVLSSFNAAVSWHEGWSGSGELGYALALLEIGGRRVGFASLVLPDGANTNQSAARLLAAGQFFAKLAELRTWKTNGPTAFLLGGTFGSGDEVSDVVLHRARAEGFTSAFLNLSRDARATRRARNQRPAAITDYLYAEGGGYVAPVQLLPNIVSDHAIQMVDWDLERTMPVIMVSEPALAANAPDSPSGSTPAESLATASGSDLFGIDLKWWVLGLGGMVVLLVIAMFRRPAPRAFDPGHALPASSGDKILFLSGPEGANRAAQRRPVLTDAERRQVRPHLLSWLKEAFIGGLLRQRSEMMSVHDTAARQADELGKRMEQIQDKLIDRIHKAEGRVVDLEQELAVAKSENRELIEANLLLAQRELAEARAKVSAQGGRVG